MWYAHYDTETNTYQGPVKLPGTVVGITMQTFYTERDALKYLIGHLEDHISECQGKLTRMRLRASALTPNPYNQ